MAAIDSGERIDRAREDFRVMRKSPTKLRDRAQREAAISKISTEMTSFAMAANKVFEFRDWARSLGLFDGVDFSPLDQFPRQDVRDLRNMREHEIDYLQGEGRAQDRWFTAAPTKIDAVSAFGSEIGGRLDYRKFAEVAKVLLAELRRCPSPQ